jgi:hypothetical protein
MIDRLKPYPVYKDSGAPWLAEVPQHWSVLPNRALFSEVKDREHPEEEMLSVTITKGGWFVRAPFSQKVQRRTGRILTDPLTN